LPSAGFPWSLCSETNLYQEGSFAHNQKKGVTKGMKRRYGLVLLLVLFGAVSCFSLPEMIEPEGPTVIHWRGDGEIGKSVLRLVDEVRGLVAVTMGAEDIRYGEPSPWSSSPSLYFDNGSNQNGGFFKVSDGPVVDLQLMDAFTIEVTLKPSSIRQSVILRKTEGTSSNGYQLVLTANGSVAFYLGNAELNRYVVSSGGAVAADTWYHVAATFGNGEMALYLNGELVQSKPFEEPLEDTSGVLGIGALVRDTEGLDTGQYYHGFIGEIKVSDYCLDPSEFLINL